MLELRLVADAKRFASMRDAVSRECERSKAAPEHAARIALVIEQLIGAPEQPRGRRPRGRASGEVFVLVTVQSDATMLLVRDPRRERDGLGERRQQLLQEHASRWSTMSGRDGRTVWAEIPRTTTAEQAVRPAEPGRTETRPTRSRERTVVIARDRIGGRHSTSTRSVRDTAPPVVTSA